MIRRRFAALALGASLVATLVAAHPSHLAAPAPVPAPITLELRGELPGAFALNTRLAAAVRNAMLDAINAQIGAGGKLRIYSGTQPTDPDAALSGNTLLAELSLSATPFASASSGSIVANTITEDAAADATGTAAFASFVTSAGVRKIDVSVGTSGANINFGSVAIQSGAPVRVTSFTLSLPMQGN